VFTRRRFMMMILGLSIILGLTHTCLLDPEPQPARTWAEVAPVAAESGAAGWMSVGDARVKLEPGARLLVAERPPSGYAAVARLERGAARFVYRGLPAGAPPRGRGVTFGVETATGIVATTGSDFRVSARQDAADVEVFEALPPWPGEPGRVMLTRTDSRRLSTLSLTAGESGRLQRGREPVKLRGAPDGQRATQSQPLQANPSPRSVP
jgi:hypothetical protein